VLTSHSLVACANADIHFHDSEFSLLNSISEYLNGDNVCMMVVSPVRTFMIMSAPKNALQAEMFTTFNPATITNIS
jgi:hypothetical protein